MKKLDEMGAGAAGGASGPPLNNTGSGTDGGVAGLGGRSGEPGVDQKKRRKSPVLASLRRKPPQLVKTDELTKVTEQGVYGGRTTFILETEVFKVTKEAHTKGLRWSRMGLSEDVVAWVRANPTKPLVVQDAISGAVLFLKH